MRYCTDTWYILKLSDRDVKAIELLNNVRFGKDELVIPIIVVSESYRKLLGKGVPENKIDSLFNEMEVVPKISVVEIDKDIAKEAAKVCLSHNVPLIDATIASTCKLLKCDFVLSDDDDLKKLHQRRYIRIKSW